MSILYRGLKLLSVNCIISLLQAFTLGFWGFFFILTITFNPNVYYSRLSRDMEHINVSNNFTDSPLFADMFHLSISTKMQLFEMDT